MKRDLAKRTSSLGRAMIYLIIAGVVIAGIALTKGKDGFYTSVFEGAKTRDWPSVISIGTDDGTRTSVSLWFFYHFDSAAKRYLYKVDEEQYFSTNYDVHGPRFVGTKEELDAFRSMGRQIPVYYNPEDPQNAVLKKGISFDKYTILYIRFGLVGIAMVMTGVLGVFSVGRTQELSDSSASVTENENAP